MRGIDPDSEDNQRATRENAAYVGGLILQQRDRDLRTIQAMERYGGGFVKALAVAAKWNHADDSNLARIKAAFPLIWERYSAMGEHEEGAQG